MEKKGKRFYDYDIHISIQHLKHKLKTLLAVCL